MNKSMLFLVTVGLLASLIVFMPQPTGAWCNQWCWDKGYTWGQGGQLGIRSCQCYKPRFGRRRRAADGEELNSDTQRTFDFEQLDDENTEMNSEPYLQ